MKIFLYISFTFNIKMISFQDKLNNMINEQINHFLHEISSSYKIPYEELSRLWENGKKQEKVVDKEVVDKEVVDKEVVDKEVVDKEVVYKEVVKNKGCIYVFKRGKNKGKICGLKCAKDSRYCSKHKKYENKEQKIKKDIVPKPVKKQTIIRMNKKINKFWHPETRLVFKTKTDRIVIGRCNEDNEIVSLTKEDMEICKSRSFAYEKLPEERKIKDAVSEAILDTNLKAKDIENILNELQINDNDINSDFDSEDEILDEED